MGTLVQDIRYGFRMLVRNPGFTIVAVLTLALGIGATTAIFSVVNAVLLDPLPAKDSDRLVEISEFEVAKDQKTSVSPRLFVDLQKQEGLFEDMTAFRFDSLVLPGEEFPEAILGFQVTPNFFTLLDVQPMTGRTFLPEEGQPGNDQVLVVSYGFWRRRLGCDPNSVGRTIISGNQAYTIIGVMPPQFQFPRRAELGEFWKPYVISPEEYSHPAARFFRILGIAARLRPEISRQRAQAMVNAIAKRLEKDYPQTNMGWRIQIEPLRNMFSDEKLQQTLLGLLGAIVFVLFIACANIANLLLVRAERRQKELAIRASLGAVRLRILRQLLTESILLSLLGGGLGLVVTYWGIDVLAARIPTTIPRLKEITVDATMLGLTCLISALVGVGFGLAPAWQSSKPRLSEVLKEGGQSSLAGFRRRHFRHLLVISEIALSLVLLAGAGLMVRSVIRLLHVDCGYDSQNILRIGVEFPFSRYREFSQREVLIRQIAEHFQALPGVQSIGIWTPGGGWDYVAEGQTASIRLSTYGCGITSSDYFQALRIPLLRGRLFAEGDVGEDQKSIIVSETMARICWPGQDPIGKRVKREDWAWADGYTVIGVVGDVKYFRRDFNPGPIFYGPYQRWQPLYAEFLVRTRFGLDPLTLTKAIRHEVKTVDAGLPAPNISSIEQDLFDSTKSQRTYMKLMGLFAGVGLLLAAVGIYGVISYSVTRRTHEIGVRMALGAQTRDVLQMVIKQGLTLALTGVAVGLGAALALTRVISSLLYDINPTDPVTFVCVSLLLAGVALLASYIPARRATKIDPMRVLKYE